MQMDFHVPLDNCLKKAGLVDPNEQHSHHGPNKAPLTLSQLRLTVIGTDGKDYTDQVTLPRPHLTWIMTNKQHSHGSTSGIVAPHVSVGKHKLG